MGTLNVHLLNQRNSSVHNVLLIIYLIYHFISFPCLTTLVFANRQFQMLRAMKLAVFAAVILLYLGREKQDYDFDPIKV